MTKFDEELKRLQSRFVWLSNNVSPFLMDTLIGREAEIEDLNAGQLEQGKDSTGDDIKPDYTPFTKSIKQAKGQPTNRVTLKDEGDFYKSIEYKVQQKGLEYQATDPKTDALQEKYGDEILGLDAQSITEITLIILDSLHKKLQTLLLK
jgi:hypothetical protein